MVILFKGRELIFLPLPGSYCPQGSSAPMGCTPGQYCDTDMMSTPAGPCLAGYYCDGNSTTDRPSGSGGQWMVFWTSRGCGFVQITLPQLSHHSQFTILPSFDDCLFVTLLSFKLLSNIVSIFHQAPPLHVISFFYNFCPYSCVNS